MRIALVRGPSLNPYEMQNIAPLLGRFSFTAFSTTYAPEWDDRLPGFTVDYCFWPDAWLKRFPTARRWFNGVCSRVLGFSYAMQGLEAKLAPYPLIHTLETHNTYSYQAARAAVRDGHRLIVTVWETIPGRGESHPWRARRKRYVNAHADAFIAVTPRAARMLETEGIPAEKITVIPMGIDQSHFKPQPPDPTLRSRWGVKSGEFVWLCVARLVDEKGITDLLHALRQGPTAWRLVLVGRGPERARYERLAETLGIRERVVFAGAFPYSRMPALYASADALVLASRPTDWWEEQFGYCLVEAMSCKLPVIAARSGAIPEVVGDAGLLAEPSSPTDWLRAMTELAGDQALRQNLAERGWVRATQEFSHLRTAEKLQALYERLGRSDR